MKFNKPKSKGFTAKQRRPREMLASGSFLLALFLNKILKNIWQRPVINVDGQKDIWMDRRTQ